MSEAEETDPDLLNISSEPWPRWDADLKDWSHTGCSHDRSRGDKEACRRLNRRRRPAPPEAEWGDVAERFEHVERDYCAETVIPFLDAFRVAMDRLADVAIFEEGEDADRMMIDLAMRLRDFATTLGTTIPEIPVCRSGVALLGAITKSYLDEER